MKKITLHTLNKMKQQAERFAVLTVYDAGFTNILNKVGIEVVFVGDSLGNVIQGRETTVAVTIEDILYHTQCVARVNKNSLLMADLPFMSYSSPQQALENASKLMRAGAEIVKMEGGEWLADTILQLRQNGIPVCGHLGLTPQSVNVLGGFRVQGREQEAAQQIIKDAMALQNAGAQLLVLECVPSILAKEITAMLTIPVIGIGAGPYCDAQVLVLYDLLGITPYYVPKFAKNFLSQTNSVEDAVKLYRDAVKQGTFPEHEHSFD